MTQRSPAPTMRRAVQRFVLGCATREAGCCAGPDALAADGPSYHLSVVILGR